MSLRSSSSLEVGVCQQLRIVPCCRWSLPTASHSLQLSLSSTFMGHAEMLCCSIKMHCGGTLILQRPLASVRVLGSHSGPRGKRPQSMVNQVGSSQVKTVKFLFCSGPSGSANRQAMAQPLLVVVCLALCASFAGSSTSSTEPAHGWSCWQATPDTPAQVCTHE